MKEEQTKRIKGMEDIDTACICYWKAGGKWLIYFPGCGVGGLGLHKIEEHEDGTITVTPSILSTFHANIEGERFDPPKQRHGYLTKGIWREV